LFFLTDGLSVYDIIKALLKLKPIYKPTAKIYSADNVKQAFEQLKSGGQKDYYAIPWISKQLKDYVDGKENDEEFKKIQRNNNFFRTFLTFDRIGTNDRNYMEY